MALCSTLWLLLPIFIRKTYSSTVIAAYFVQYLPFLSSGRPLKRKSCARFTLHWPPQCRVNLLAMVLNSNHIREVKFDTSCVKFLINCKFKGKKPQVITQTYTCHLWPQNLQLMKTISVWHSPSAALVDFTVILCKTPGQLIRFPRIYFIVFSFFLDALRVMT